MTTTAIMTMITTTVNRTTIGIFPSWVATGNSAFLTGRVNSSQQYERRQMNNRRFLILIMVSVALITGAGFCIIALSPSEKSPGKSIPGIKVGEIVDKKGRFRFPEGNRILAISEDATGNICVVVLAPSKVIMCVPIIGIPYRTVPSHVTESRDIFESERNWFVSVDQYDRLWVYYGRWEKSWGPLRELPGGTTRPYAPAVLVYGLELTRPDAPVFSGWSVNETSDWVGVPAPFLEKVRNATTTEPEDKLFLPTETPAFTPHQELLLFRRLGRPDRFAR